MVNGTSRHVRVGSLKLFPQSKPADPQMLDELLSLWNSKRSFIILSGPPGIGKTRTSEDVVLEMLKYHRAPHSNYDARITVLFPDFKHKVYSNDEIRSALLSKQIRFVWDICVLHPEYTYEDLIRGYRIVSSLGKTSRMEVREGLLGFIARVVSVMEEINPATEYPQGYLVLDEINRAPIGQLFGESLYAVDRRGFAVATPYNLDGIGSDLTIPQSLLLLGTMNSVDRAVSGFDFALRRRFAVLTMTPKEKPIEERWNIFSDPARQNVLRFYRQIRQLILDATKTGIVPTTELVIGHSYFLPPDSITDKDAALKWLAESYKYQILPILIDYQEQGLLKFLDGSSLPGSEVLSERQALGDLDINDIIGYLNSASS